MATVGYLIESVALVTVGAIGVHAAHAARTKHSVSNRSILVLFAIGVVAHLTAVCFDVSSLGYFLGVLVIGLGVGVGLAVRGFWGPVEGKLFVALCVALPPTLNSRANASLLDSSPVALASNFGVCYVLLVVATWSRRVLRRPLRQLHFKRWNRRLLLAVVDVMGLGGLAVPALQWLLGRDLSYSEALAGIVALYLIASRFITTENRALFAIPGAMAFTYISHESLVDLRECLALIAGAWVAVVPLSWVRASGSYLSTEIIPASKLSAGAVPAFGLGVNRRTGRVEYTDVNGVPKTLESLCAADEPLTEHQITYLRQLAEGHALPCCDKVQIRGRAPFVQMTVSAGLLTGAMGGSVVSLVLDLIR